VKSSRLCGDPSGSNLSPRLRTVRVELSTLLSTNRRDIRPKPRCNSERAS
jgi:hypothetical protein